MDAVKRKQKQVLLCVIMQTHIQKKSYFRSLDGYLRARGQSKQTAHGQSSIYGVNKVLSRNSASLAALLAAIQRVQVL